MGDKLLLNFGANFRYGGRIGTKMPLNQVSCHWIIDAVSLDRTSSYRTIFFMPLDRILCHWIVGHSIGRYFSCHWIGLHAILHPSCPSRHWIGLNGIGSEFISMNHTSFYRTIFFMSLDQTSCHWIISIGDHPKKKQNKTTKQNNNNKKMESRIPQSRIRKQESSKYC